MAPPIYKTPRPEGCPATRSTGPSMARTDSNATHIRVHRSRRIHRAILIPTCHAIARRGVPAVLRICAAVVLPPVVCHSGDGSSPSTPRSPFINPNTTVQAFPLCDVVRSLACGRSGRNISRAWGLNTVGQLAPPAIGKHFEGLPCGVDFSSKTPDPFDASRLISFIKDA